MCLGDAAEVSVFEAVGLAAEVDDFGVVDQAVDHGGCDDVVSEDFSPAAEGLVAGDDQAGSFVAAGDELEEQVRCFGFEGDVADFVDDQQGVAAEASELVLQSPVVVGCCEPVDPFAGGGELDAVAGLAGADCDPGGEVGLAVSRVRLCGRTIESVLKEESDTWEDHRRFRRRRRPGSC